MPEYLHPGVYIEEIERGPRPIEGVPTSTAAFLGEAERGAITPRLVTSYQGIRALVRGRLRGRQVPALHRQRVLRERWEAGVHSPSGRRRCGSRLFGLRRLQHPGCGAGCLGLAGVRADRPQHHEEGGRDRCRVPAAARVLERPGTRLRPVPARERDDRCRVRCSPRTSTTSSPTRRRPITTGSVCPSSTSTRGTRTREPRAPP